MIFSMKDRGMATNFRSTTLQSNAKLKAAIRSALDQQQAAPVPERAAGSADPDAAVRGETADKQIGSVKVGHAADDGKGVSAPWAEGGAGGLPLLVHAAAAQHLGLDELSSAQGVASASGGARAAVPSSLLPSQRCPSSGSLPSVMLSSEADCGEGGVDAAGFGSLEATGGGVMGDARGGAVSGPRTLNPKPAQRLSATHDLWGSVPSELPSGHTHRASSLPLQQHPYAMPYPPHRPHAPAEGRYKEDSLREGGKGGRTQQQRQQQNYHPRGHKAHSYLPGKQAGGLARERGGVGWGFERAHHDVPCLRNCRWTLNPKPQTLNPKP